MKTLLTFIAGSLVMLIGIGFMEMFVYHTSPARNKEPSYDKPWTVFNGIEVPVITSYMDWHCKNQDWNVRLHHDHTHPLSRIDVSCSKIY